METNIKKRILAFLVVTAMVFGLVPMMAGSVDTATTAMSGTFVTSWTGTPGNQVTATKVITKVQPDDCMDYNVNLKLEGSLGITQSAVKYDVVIVLDDSISMRETDYYPVLHAAGLSRVAVMKEATIAFIEELKANSPNSRVEILIYANQVTHTTNTFTRVGGIPDVATHVNNAYAQHTVRDSTNIPGAIAEASDVLTKRSLEDKRDFEPIILFMSDGVANIGGRHGSGENSGGTYDSHGAYAIGAYSNTGQVPDSIDIPGRGNVTIGTELTTKYNRTGGSYQCHINDVSQHLRGHTCSTVAGILYAEQAKATIKGTGYAADLRIFTVGLFDKKPGFYEDYTKQTPEPVPSNGTDVGDIVGQDTLIKMATQDDYYFHTDGKDASLVYTKIAQILSAPLRVIDNYNKELFDVVEPSNNLTVNSADGTITWSIGSGGFTNNMTASYKLKFKNIYEGKNYNLDARTITSSYEVRPLGLIVGDANGTSSSSSVTINSPAFAVSATGLAEQIYAGGNVTFTANPEWSGICKDPTTGCNIHENITYKWYKVDGDDLSVMADAEGIEYTTETATATGLTAGTHIFVVEAVTGAYHRASAVVSVNVVAKSVLSIEKEVAPTSASLTGLPTYDTINTFALGITNWADTASFDLKDDNGKYAIFRITVSNSSTTPATGVDIIDVFEGETVTLLAPAGVTNLENFTVPGKDGDTNGSVVFYYAVPITDARDDAFVNTATISSLTPAETDINPNSDSADYTVTDSRIYVILTKEVAEEIYSSTTSLDNYTWLSGTDDEIPTFVRGDEVIYKITVVNNSPRETVNITLADLISQGTNTSLPLAVFDSSLNSQSFPDPIAAEDTKTYYVIFDTTGRNTGSYTNTATATDVAKDVDESDTADIVVTAPNVTVEKLVNDKKSETILVNNEVTYTVTYKNEGNAEAVITVDDVFDSTDGIEFVEGYDVPNGQTIPLASGATKIFTYKVKFTETGTFENTARYVYHGTNEGLSSDAVVHVKEPGIDVTKTARGYIVDGATFTSIVPDDDGLIIVEHTVNSVDVIYAIIVTNDGNVALTDVTLAESMVGGKWFNSLEDAKADKDGSAEFEPITLGVGEPDYYWFRTTIDIRDLGDIDVPNTVIAKGTPNDPELPELPDVRDEDSADVTIIKRKLDIEKKKGEGSESVTVGNDVEFTITVTNNSSRASETGLTLEDILRDEDGTEIAKLSEDTALKIFTNLTVTKYKDEIALDIKDGKYELKDEEALEFLTVTGFELEPGESIVVTYKIVFDDNIAKFDDLIEAIEGLRELQGLLEELNAAEEEFNAAEEEDLEYEEWLNLITEINDKITAVVIPAVLADLDIDLDDISATIGKVEDKIEKLGQLSDLMKFTNKATVTRTEDNSSIDDDENVNVIPATYKVWHYLVDNAGVIAPSPFKSDEVYTGIVGSTVTGQSTTPPTGYTWAQRFNEHERTGEVRADNSLILKLYYVSTDGPPPPPPPPYIPPVVEVEDEEEDETPPPPPVVDDEEEDDDDEEEDDTDDPVTEPIVTVEPTVDPIPLGDGYFAIPVETEEGEPDVYEILGEDGVPLGYMEIPEGEDITEYFDVEEIIPLVNFAPETSTTVEYTTIVLEEIIEEEVNEPVIEEPVEEPIPTAPQTGPTAPPTNDATMISILLAIISGAAAVIFKRRRAI